MCEFKRAVSLHFFALIHSHMSTNYKRINKIDINFYRVIFLKKKKKKKEEKEQSESEEEDEDEEREEDDERL